MFLIFFVVDFFICTPILSGMTKLREAFPRESTTRGFGVRHSLCCSHTRELLTFLSFSMFFEPEKLLRPIDKNLIPDHIIEMSFNLIHATQRLANENYASPHPLGRLINCLAPHRRVSQNNNFIACMLV